MERFGRQRDETNQIKDKRYPQALEDYKDNLLLVCVNYDKNTKVHTCKIENFTGK
jgi:hypothetical protein